MSSGTLRAPTAEEAHDMLMLRSVGAMSIAEGDEGWQRIALDCPMLVAVAKLRRDYDALSAPSPTAQAPLADAIPQSCPECPLGPGAPCNEQCEPELERHEWTPQQALEFYAAGKHFDVVGGRTRIIDTGAVASDALKQMSAQYADMKGVEPTAQARESAALLQARNEVDQRRIALLEKTLKDLSFAAQITGGVAGRDDGLVAAIDEAAKVLDVNTYEIEPVPSAQAREALADSLDEYAQVLARGDDAMMDMLTSAARELRSLSANAGGAWQPIETAPRDGTRVLIACIGECGTLWMYVAWNNGRHWRLVERKNASYIEVRDTPTHWQPLPAPPKAGAR